MALEMFYDILSWGLMGLGCFFVLIGQQSEPELENLDELLMSINTIPTAPHHGNAGCVLIGGFPIIAKPHEMNMSCKWLPYPQCPQKTHGPGG